MPGISPRSTGWPQRGQFPSGVTEGGVRNLLQCTHHATDAIGAGWAGPSPIAARGPPGAGSRQHAGHTDGLRGGVDEHLLEELDLARGAVSRRTMLKGLGALAAGAALSACSSSASSKSGTPTTLRRATGAPSTP